MDRRIIEVKQGIEIEACMRPIKYIESSWNSHKRDVYPNTYRGTFPDYTSLLHSNLKKGNIYKYPNWDTGDCVEMDTLPFFNLSDLYDNTKYLMEVFFETAEESNSIVNFLGTTPLCWYAGGHIHNSCFPAKEVNIRTIKNKLWRFQPFLSLLGQNSSLRIKNKGILNNDSSIKDARLVIAGTQFSSYGGCDGRLRQDNSKHTLELRYPSCGGLIQLMGYTAFVKACILSDMKNLTKKEIYDIELFLATLTQKIVVWGGTSSYSILYRGEKYNTTIGKAFKMLLSNPEFAECMDTILSELSGGVRRRILEFFDIFKKEYSMTDIYQDILSMDNFLEKYKKLHLLQKREVWGFTTAISSLNKLNDLVRDPNYLIDESLIDYWDINNQIVR